MCNTMKQFSKFYKNSIDVVISPEHTVYHQIDTYNIPNKISISYCDVAGIKVFFETQLGKSIKINVVDNKTKLIMIPTDSVGVTDSEFDYLIENQTFFRNENVRFYQSWYDDRLKFNYHFGSTIHSALDFYINYTKTNKYDICNKRYHFITLNNKESILRKKLYNFYNNLRNIDKDKIICSFRFAGIHLDSIAGEEMHNFNEAYGESLINIYESSYMEIVSESSMTSITEKSYKPLLSETPFIYWNVNHPPINYQLKFFEDIDIDINYFGIDYFNENSIRGKINEILNTPKTDLLTKYNYAFELASQNKIKILNFIELLEKELVIYE